MHYFIDESGDLEIGPTTSKYFLIGCIITDNPKKVLAKINALRKEILNSGFLSRHWEDFDKQGFHATSNHPDIYNLFINLLNTTSFRAYFIIIEKETTQFKNLILRLGKQSLYDELIKTILLDRIIKDGGKHITISFEQNLSNPTIKNINRRRSELRIIVGQITKKALIKKRNASKSIIKVNLKNKTSEPRLALVDYMNHVLLSYLLVTNRKPRNIENYQLLEKKIGIIHDYLTDKFYQPRKEPFII
jgi:hypothetical protein